jgi:hypothetical protein
MPIIAGIIKLIIHNTDEAYSIPKLLLVAIKYPKKNAETFTLTPSSVMVNDGIIVCVKKIIQIITNAGSNDTSILKMRTNK